MVIFDSSFEPEFFIVESITIVELISAKSGAVMLVTAMS